MGSQAGAWEPGVKTIPLYDLEIHMQKRDLKIWESKEGFKRLSILSGVVGLILWTTFFLCGLLAPRGWGKIPAERSYIIILPFSFLIPWGLVKLIKWTLDGFGQKEERKEDRGE